MIATLTESKDLLQKAEQKRATLRGLACIAVLAGILVAGLWPFHAPKNQVDWLPDRNGLWFGQHGTVLSTGPFNVPGTSGAESCGLEIWLAPTTIWDRRSTILAFYAPNRTIPFSVHQSNRDLLIESQRNNAKPYGAAAKLYVNRVFRAHRTVFIAITSDGRGTEVYIDGTLAADSRQFAFTREDLRGELVLANSPVIDDSWSGRLRGLAVYNQFLTRPVALQDFQSWRLDGHPALTEGRSLVALYRFDRLAGQVIHNQTGPGPDLRIPRRYTVFDQCFLQRPWDEYRPGRNYWKTIFLNIGGFVPLGFFFFAYLSLARPTRRAALMTILLGAIVSVTIEVLQGFLPTRDSGMTDIITNTLGTAVGAGLYGWIRLVFSSRSGSRHKQLRESAV